MLVWYHRPRGTVLFLSVPQDWSAGNSLTITAPPSSLPSISQHHRVGILGQPANMLEPSHLRLRLSVIRASNFASKSDPCVQLLSAVYVEMAYASHRISSSNFPDWSLAGKTASLGWVCFPKASDVGMYAALARGNVGWAPWCLTRGLIEVWDNFCWSQKPGV